MGNLIARKRSKRARRRVLLACHIDEIGFYVRHVDDKGFVKIHNAGSFDTRNLLARRVIQSSGGGDLIGLMNPGGRPIHIAKDEDRKKIPAITDFSIDLCLPPDDREADGAHRRPGDARAGVRRDRPVRHRQNLDNRVAAFVAIEAVR